jgi:hypothetical protein
MREDGYRGGGTLGGKWGCALSALVGLPVISLGLLVSALGDCAPDMDCNHRITWLLFIPGIVIAALVGFGSRAIINRMNGRRGGRR